MLKSKLTAKQFNRWKAWHGLEPRGEDRADLQIATLTAIIKNQTSTEPVSIADMLFALRDLWNPPDEKEKLARAEAKKQAKREQSRKKFVAMGKAKLNGR